MSARPRTALVLAVLAAAGCRRAPTDAAHRASVEVATKQHLLARVDEWLEAARALEKTAPKPRDRGWDALLDAEALEAMKAAWARARNAYELVEGALAPIFPESDVATDARYEDYLLALGARGDSDPFDGRGVIGMHGIERVLWADRIPREVVTFEEGLPGYRPAAFPATEGEAAAFRTKLAARLVADVEALRASLVPLELDAAFAFRGLVDLAVEQVEKVDRAATGQEESRYARATMRDLRANRQGCLDAYRIFRPWLLTRREGEELDRRLLSAFDRLATAFGAVPGDAIPTPPSTWSAIDATAADRATAFGRLHAAVKREADEAVPGSLHAGLLAAAAALDLPIAELR